MKVDFLWSRQLYQVVDSHSFIVDSGNIYTIERGNNLIKIDVLSGLQKWSIKVPIPSRWLSLHNEDLYYLSQYNDLLIIDTVTGEIKSCRKINLSFPGYIVPINSTFITGGWRGYSNLTCYDLATFEEIWSKDITAKEAIQFSIPLVLNNLLFTVNHSTGEIKILSLNNGDVKFDFDLPDNLDCPDLGRSYQVIDGKVTFVTRDGRIYTLSDDFSHFSCEDLDIEYIATILPLFYKGNIMYEDNYGNYCLYNRDERKVKWTIKIENNVRIEMCACGLAEDFWAIAGSLGKVMILDSNGTRIAHVAEKRITTPLTRINDLIVYTNKSEIKVIKFRVGAIHELSLP
jgi:outer membrane protein assembly factor BamB